VRRKGRAGAEGAPRSEEEERLSCRDEDRNSRLPAGTHLLPPIPGSLPGKPYAVRAPGWACLRQKSCWGVFLIGPNVSF
jgi:hypothetical protein